MTRPCRTGNSPRTSLAVPSVMPRETDWLNVAREILAPVCPHLRGCDGVCVRCGETVEEDE